MRPGYGLTTMLDVLCTLSCSCPAPVLLCAVVCCTVRPGIYALILGCNWQRCQHNSKEFYYLCLQQKLEIAGLACIWRMLELARSPDRRCSPVLDAKARAISQLGHKLSLL